MSAAGGDHLRSRRIFTYAELAAVAAGTGQEPLVDVRSYDRSIAAAPPEGGGIRVRDSVARMLASAQRSLRPRNVRLQVVDGHRPASLQRRYFAEMRRELAAREPALAGAELDERVHAFVAMPEVAGHPTGGAVDVTLLDGAGRELDMGGALADFHDPDRIRTFAEGLSEGQQGNRRLLHDAMVAAGFAPFYGEWWHFSYGDREWAAMYGRPAALYGPVE